MPTKTLIDHYEVLYSSNTFVPRIYLVNTAGSFFGQLIFKPNGSSLPQDSPGAVVSLYYHLEDFKNIIDLLRNEKPLYLNWAGSGPGWENTIMTSDEPVGEGEK